MNQKTAFYIYLILTILWMGVIFWFSSHPADVSKTESGRVLAVLKQIYSSATGTQINETFIELVHTLVRKSGHLFVYMVLGIFTLSAILSYLRQQDRGVPAEMKYFFLALVICIVYAASDELHQVFVPGRGGRAYDVLIDGIGALIGISSVFPFESLKGRPSSQG